MGMDEFYPNKLSWLDVITIRSEQTSLVLAIIEKLLMMDHRVPLSTVQTPASSSHEPFFLSPFDDECHETDAPTTHPMDVMNVIYNCCNDVLLQILMEKLFLCRLSIPLLYPDSRRSKLVFSLWYLRTITSKWKDDGRAKDLSLVNMPQNFVTFIRIGEDHLHISKSKLLNRLLTPTHHNTFFHRGCENGMSTRVISEGTIEAAWYMSSKADQSYTILNLRGNALRFEKQTEWLGRISNLIVLMFNMKAVRNREYTEIIELIQRLRKNLFIFLVADSIEQIKINKGNLNELQEYLQQVGINSNSISYNCDGKRLRKGNEIEKIFRKVIDLHLECTGAKISLDKLATDCELLNFCSIENEPVCKNAFLNADNVRISVQTILCPKERKGTFLPLQGELWKELGELTKEFNRKKITENPTDFLANFFNKRNNIWEKQFVLLNARSKIVTDIFFQLNGDTAESPYFVIWLEILLNNLSREMKHLIEDEYRTKKQQPIPYGSTVDPANQAYENSQKKALEDLRNDLIKVSFGLEHIFREFGQWFEVYSRANDKELPQELKTISYLPKIVANSMLQGLPFEIMDGDTAFIPTKWVVAVFKELEHLIGNKYLLVVSAVGIQSSGKSTLLNAMFGLKFAVSAGRCTKGLYSVLIPVDKQSMGVGYDYILVIDTEGLRAPELKDAGQVHDNELATLVIGLSDVTIVNIKGENHTDMNDILQIVTHAMIRISQVSDNLMKPSCFFVHQNVSAADADDKLIFNQDAFLTRLNEITVAAAEKENCGKILNFRDVINYDEHKFAFYMPDVWQGQPPMARFNHVYSEKVREIRDFIFQSNKANSHRLTISQFTTRLSDLWDAILKENFVFSFRNCEELNAFSSLDRKYSQMCFSMNDVSLELQICCGNEMQSSEDEKKLEEQERLVKEKIESKLSNKLKSLKEQFNQYFEENENRRILEQWRSRYMTNLENFCEDEQSRIIRALRTIVERRITYLKTSHAANLQCHKDITEAAIQAAKELREKNTEFDDEQLYKYFLTDWEKWIGRIGQKYDESKSEETIVRTFQTELKNSFHEQKHLLDQIESDPLRNHNIWKYTFQRYELEVSKDDLHSFNSRFGVEYSKPAKCLCKDVIKNIDVYIRECRGTDFTSAQATKVTEMLKNHFLECDEMNKENGFNFNHKFQIRLYVDVFRCSINGFIENKKAFEASNDPYSGICDNRSYFFTLFKNIYSNAAQEQIAADRFVAGISQTVKETVKKNLGLLIEETAKCDEIFKSKLSFWKTIMRDFWGTNNLNDFWEYQEKPALFYQRKMIVYIREILLRYAGSDPNTTQMRLILKQETDKRLTLLRSCLNEIRESAPFESSRDFTEKFKQVFIADPASSTFSYAQRMLEDLNLSPDTDFVRFIGVVIDDCLGSLSDRIVDDMFCDERLALVDPDFVTQFENLSQSLLKRVRGCTAKCPFCGAPCKYHENHDTEIKHVALEHFPQGVRGICMEETGKLCLQNCNFLVDTDLKFNVRNVIENRDESSWSSFRKMFGVLKDFLVVNPFIPYKEYASVFHQWEIQNDRNMETSKYWKWFMCKFQNHLVGKFKVKSFDIRDFPEDWKLIRYMDAEQSLESIIGDD